MGKIIAVIIAVMMLVGCSTVAVNQEDYINEMETIATKLSNSMSLTVSTLRNETDSKEYARKLRINYEYTNLMLAELKELTPPDELEEAHGHFIAFVSRISDATLAMLQDDGSTYEQAMEKATKERNLAGPIFDKFKGD